MKDWDDDGKTVPEKEKEQLQKGALTDELTSVLIWFFIAANCAETISLRFGVAIGSIFALGGT